MQSRDKDDIVIRLQFIRSLAFKLPVRIVDQHEYSSSPISVSETAFISIVVAVTYTVSSKTNISFRGSFMRFSQSHRIRKATVDGCPSPCAAGTETLCFRLSEKSISRPPLLQVSRCEIWV
jgi:hypothetical protein